MFGQFQMIRRSEKPKVMARYHGTMGPRYRISLPHVLNYIVFFVINYLFQKQHHTTHRSTRHFTIHTCMYKVVILFYMNI